MQIGEVTVNLDFYKGTDVYSDGDVEDEILDFAKRGLTYEQALEENDSWPVVYHLSPVRENLLSWYPFPKGCSVLEIGAGCGAVTGGICKSAGAVTTIDLSKRRSEILANRHKDAKNLEVIVGNLNDVKFPGQFDVVTLVGVLEYAGSFTDTRAPHRDFLKNIKRLLRPNGTLLVAIANRYGMKYWSGAPEDHTSLYFDGIEGYKRGAQARTFSRNELASLIEASGFKVKRFYYPMPDYKMPVQIFSDDALPKRGEIEAHVPHYHAGRFRLFDESAAFDGVIDEGMFPFFANSFLVDCRAEGA
ncbi:MAG: class I SAM-dependent methyltransferase [Armatimonadetes bacterium]|nr:class I SAM-dependent methyltransferase [Armatimonadota bacterium]